MRSCLHLAPGLACLPARGFFASRLPDSRAGAAYFLDMLSGTVRLQCLIGLRQPPDPQEIDEIVQGAVTQFLYGCLVLEENPHSPENS